MTQVDLGLTIKGTVIPDETIRATLLALPATGFSRADVEGALKNSSLPLPITGDVTRRILQHLKRKGVIAYDAQTGAWSVLDSQEPPAQTEPLDTAAHGPGMEVAHTPVIPAARTKTRRPVGTVIISFVMHLACMAVVIALVTINAGFAWELAETRAFRVSLVVGLMGCDLMRPLLVARGLIDIEARRQMRGVAAICLALSLAPLSILSTTSVVSATLFAGVEENDQTLIRNATLSTLRPEYERLRASAVSNRKAWEEECARGGCGPRAAEFEAAYLKAEIASQTLLSKMVTMTEAVDERSSFIARLVRSFGELGLFDETGRMLIPLLLALTLELAALFGPGLLLTRTRR